MCNVRLCARAVSRPALLMSSRSRQPRAVCARRPEAERSASGSSTVLAVRTARPPIGVRRARGLAAARRASPSPSSAQRDRISNLSNCISLYLYLCVTCVQRSIDDYFTDM